MKILCPRCKEKLKADKWKNQHKQDVSKWVKQHPEKVKAHQLAHKYKNQLKKEICEKCGDTGKLHMHHPDYSQPLLVITLCIPCHVGVHYARD